MVSILRVAKRGADGSNGLDLVANLTNFLDSAEIFNSCARREFAKLNTFSSLAGLVT